MQGAPLAQLAATPPPIHLAHAAMVGDTYLSVSLSHFFVSRVLGDAQHGVEGVTDTAARTLVCYNLLQKTFDDYTLHIINMDGMGGGHEGNTFRSDLLASILRFLTLLPYIQNDIINSNGELSRPQTST